MRHLIFKTLTLIALLTSIAFHASAQGTNVSLVLTMTDGEEITYQLSEDSQLYFEGGSRLTIDDGTGSPETYPLAQIRKMVCTEITDTPEDEAARLRVLPNPCQDHFLIQDLAGPCLARIYSLDGRLVKAFQASEGLSVDLTDLSSGMYLLHINGQTLKLMKL